MRAVYQLLKAEEVATRSDGIYATALAQRVHVTLPPPARGLLHVWKN